MIHTLDIENFRCFDKFHMENIARVNLLVGGNNCGKTALLEAIHLLGSGGNPGVLNQIATRRSEFNRVDLNQARVINVANFFNGYQATDKNPIHIRMTLDNFHEVKDLYYKILSHKEINEKYPIQESDAWEVAPGNNFVISGLIAAECCFPINNEGEISIRHLSRLSESYEDTSIASVFLDINGYSKAELYELLSEQSLKEDFEYIEQSISNIIDNSIERIAPIAKRSANDYIFNVYVRIKQNGTSQIVLLGSLGEGVSRLLGICLAIVKSKSKICLIDEIDTGLHAAVMENMWKMVIETAKRLNVRVFATTHSYDCIEALAAYCMNNEVGDNEVALHRIEKEKGRAVYYSKDHIIAAAERHIEVR